ncbi:MAG: hypothetical protein WC597_16255 [Brevundimonas sp.]
MLRSESRLLDGQRHAFRRKKTRLDRSQNPRLDLGAVDPTAVRARQFSAFSPP